MSRRKIDGTIIAHSRDAHGQMLVADDGIIRSLYFGDGIMQSCMRLDDPAALLMEYSQALLLPLVFNGAPQNVLMLGLGGGSLINFLLRYAPGAALETVELRADVVRLAHKFFSVPRQHARLTVHIEDAADFVKRRSLEGARYDLILLDAFDDNGPAAALMNDAFITLCCSILTANGFCSANLWTRQRDNFPALFRMIQEIFEGRCLKLSLGDVCNNAVVVAYNRDGLSGDLMSYRPRARLLQQEMRINFLRYLMSLYRQNQR